MRRLEAKPDAAPAGAGYVSRALGRLGVNALKFTQFAQKRIAMPTLLRGSAFDGWTREAKQILVKRIAKAGWIREQQLSPWCGSTAPQTEKPPVARRKALRDCSFVADGEADRDPTDFAPDGAPPPLT